MIALDVVTPDKSVVKNIQVDSVILPGENGQMNILPGHISLVTNLKPGTFAYLKDGTWQWAVLSGGFAQIAANNLIVLAETVELARDIDFARAELALKKAEDILKKEKHGSPEFENTLQAKSRALARMQLAKEKK